MSCARLIFGGTQLILNHSSFQYRNSGKEMCLKLFFLNQKVKIELISSQKDAMNKFKQHIFHAKVDLHFL